MPIQKKQKRPKWENIKMRAEIVERLRENKAKNDTPIIKFVERAVLEKLEKEKK